MPCLTTGRKPLIIQRSVAFPYRQRCFTAPLSGFCGFEICSLGTHIFQITYRSLALIQVQQSAKFDETAEFGRQIRKAFLLRSWLFRATDGYWSGGLVYSVNELAGFQGYCPGVGCCRRGRCPGLPCGAGCRPG